jgi:predicted NUDIX family NTP pyrophosphohydrolase
MEWPPHSGQMKEFPEIDRVDFFDVPTARRKIKDGQAGLIEELANILGLNE